MLTSCTFTCLTPAVYSLATSSAARAAVAGGHDLAPAAVAQAVLPADAGGTRSGARVERPGAREEVARRSLSLGREALDRALGRSG